MVKISNEVKVVKINICVRVFRVDYLLCNSCTMKKKSKLDIKLLSSRNYKTQNELCTITEHGHLKDKAFMMKIASKRHQVAD